MIYVVVGTQSGFDWYHHENFFASTSKEIAELKLEELIEKQKRSKIAYEEFNHWICNNVLVDPKEKKYEIAIKYNVDYEDVSYNEALEFEIEEVESD